MRKIYIVGLLTLLGFVVTSCNKWLDLQPQDGITKAEFWKTKEDVRAALMGIYSSLNAGPVETRVFLWGELRADMVNVSSYAADDYRLVKNYNVLSTNDIANWGALYNVINNCNLLIDFAPEAKAVDPTFTEATYNSYVGEALTIRSLLYFYLIRTFKEIPLKLKGSYRDTDVQNIGAVSADKVLSQLEQDLKQAQTLVPDYHVTLGNNFSINPSNTGRITKPAVHMLLAEVYMWKEQYALAEVELNKVLSTQRYQLIGRVASNSFDISSSETIFEISHKDSRANPLTPLVYVGRIPYIALTEVINMDFFPPNMEVDVDKSDSRGEGVLYLSSGMISKYGTENPSYYNFPIFRISDALLLKAEAAAEQGRGAEALQLIAELRESRGAIEASNRQLNESDLDDIIQFIFEERAREFAFEGKRWFDVLRLAKKDNYSNIGVLIDVVTKIVDASVQQSALNKVRDVNSHYLPIHEEELFKDNTLVQNPFYLK
ncbi:RagB/SusD family nutrient uptake outer membrane protein [Sphingobacterium litopenaei]|uniref:RagB/SusD family nutrient uptake outer membrane protein n=1 Tax=Sphingobacterium litopenaei TaxID=2763500 RepID=A0ABR7YBE8_9SPHI|nr:RagB/SusD family nutrient uptake outer membrane protein [Sphingobacterium litopenaei]MBD1428631.1 RagB/SusD family nutrient uptake outer membrane protein [Sphingobacterium litopenaei]